MFNYSTLLFGKWIDFGTCASYDSDTLGRQDGGYKTKVLGDSITQVLQHLQFIYYLIKSIKGVVELVDLNIFVFQWLSLNLGFGGCCYTFVE